MDMAVILYDVNGWCALTGLIITLFNMFSELIILFTIIPEICKQKSKIHTTLGWKFNMLKTSYNQLNDIACEIAFFSL